MKVVTTTAQVRDEVRRLRDGGGTLGLVPTMGALHDGHLSLVGASVAENARTVMSIFVNPTQFGPLEDVERYPRDLEGDCRKAEAAGVDLVFAGSAADLYPAGYATYVIQERLTEGLCGASRPTHFRGVLTIVLKLFNVVRPDAAYFGRKDAQQAAVIRRMARDLDTGIAIRVLPIVREPDGLAMSSRNVYLSPARRRSAAVIYESLTEAADAVAGGMRAADRIKELVRRRIAAEGEARVEYVELVDPDDMTPISLLERSSLLVVAVHIGPTRLIDNIILEPV